MTDEVLKFLRVPPERQAEPAVREAADLLLAALSRFALLLAPAERPGRAADLIDHVATTASRATAQPAVLLKDDLLDAAARAASGAPGEDRAAGTR